MGCFFRHVKHFVFVNLDHRSCCHVTSGYSVFRDLKNKTDSRVTDIRSDLGGGIHAMASFAVVLVITTVAEVTNLTAPLVVMVKAVFALRLGAISRTALLLMVSCELY